MFCQKISTTEMYFFTLTTQFFLSVIDFVYVYKSDSEMLFYIWILLYNLFLCLTHNYKTTSYGMNHLHHILITLENDGDKILFLAYQGLYLTMNVC